MYILYSDRQAWKLTSANKFKNKATDEYQLEDEIGKWKFTKYNPPENRDFRIQANEQEFYIETPDNKVLQRTGKSQVTWGKKFGNVVKKAKKEGEAKQLWKKKPIDGNHFRIQSSNFETNPKTTKDMVLTALGDKKIGLRGISHCLNKLIIQYI